MHLKMSSVEVIFCKKLPCISDESTNDVVMLEMVLWISITICVLYDFLLTVKAALYECVIRTGQP